MGDLIIETITDNLADGYNELEKGTFQESSEVQNQRRADPSLRSRWTYTANLPLFRIQNGNLEYGLSGRQTFDAIAGEDIGKFTRQIVGDGVYRLDEQQIKQLEGLDANIVWAKAEDLDLKKQSDEGSYLLIDTSDIKAEKLNDAQKPFAVKVHGSMESKYYPEQKLPDYGENMNMLAEDGGIRQTRLWLPTPSHIGGYLKEGGVVARASRLSSFSNRSNVDADDRNADVHGALRGVLFEKVAEGDAPKPHLDELVGKGVDAGRGVAVVHEGDISPGAWQLLTRKQ